MIRCTVLAIGTDVGKTHIGCLMLEHAAKAGLTIDALKPVMSGFSPKNFAECDVGRLQIACGQKASLSALSKMCLYAFEPAMAPNAAARRQHTVMDEATITQFTRTRSAAATDFMLIEGAGGVLTPLTEKMLNADLAKALGYPVILVSANYLGAISHSLTAIEALERRNIPIAAMAISQPHNDMGPPAILAEELEGWTKIPMLEFPFNDTKQWRQSSAAILSAAARHMTGKPYP